mmetsp:Transcript_15526/g.21035  ORF Transcript_15526/g.21035 Transcript_15526/m.21035 type:complete len:93 (+) Transcript_15526:231-509(+)
MVESSFGKVCDEANNGQVALDMYKRSMTKTCCSKRYQVIFTDIQMPEMDGLTEATLIKKFEKQYRLNDKSLPIVEIVVVSAYDDPETVKKCK